MPTPEQWFKLKHILNLDDEFDTDINATIEVEVTDVFYTEEKEPLAINKTPGGKVHRETTGWLPTCECNAETQPCQVLDPFGGSGTVGFVADRLNRDSVLIEINPDYAEMARERIMSNGGLFTTCLTE